MKYRDPNRPTGPPALGIDIGRVIISPAGDDSADTEFLGVPDERALQVPPAPGSFQAIADLWRRFEGRVWLVSKAGPKIERKTILWLSRHAFHEATGMPERNVRFCRERAEKRMHAEKLKLTHFVDDRGDVLRHLLGVVPHLFLFGLQTGTIPPWVHHVADWTAARNAIVRSMGPDPSDAR